MEPFQEALAVLITDTPTPVRNAPVNDTHIATFTELDTVNEINEVSSEQEVRRAIVEARFQEYIKDPGEDKPTIPEWQMSKAPKKSKEPVDLTWKWSDAPELPCNTYDNVKEKVPLLLFSGGADSTYRLAGLLKEGPVDVLYVDGGQHPLKTIKELECREETIRKLEQRSLHKVSGRFYFDLSVCRKHPGSFPSWRQVMPWIFAAHECLSDERHSRLEICYLLEDCISSVRHELEELWANLCYIQTGSRTTIPLNLPFIRTNKTRIYEALSRSDERKELLDSIWVCETPHYARVPRTRKRKIVACGRCVPCKDQKRAIEDSGILENSEKQLIET